MYMYINNSDMFKCAPYRWSLMQTLIHSFALSLAMRTRTNLILGVSGIRTHNLSITGPSGKALVGVC